MKTINNSIDGLKKEKELSWLFTAVFMIIGWPILKNTIVFILQKLYDFIIQNSLEK